MIIWHLIQMERRSRCGSRPRHAYTKGLLASIPRLENERKSELATIPGQVAAIRDFVPGCRFCQRMERDVSALHQRPSFEEISPGHWVEACRYCYSDE